MELIEKKRKCFLWFPIRFKTYSIVKGNNGDYELHVKSGLLSSHLDKIKLYKINDVTYHRSFGNLFFGVANLIISSSDKSSRGTITIEKIHGVKDFQEKLEDLVSEERQRINVAYRETEIL